jgi:hypothetical protein
MCRITKKCTRVADRPFPEVKVTWRQPGDFGRSSDFGVSDLISIIQTIVAISAVAFFIWLLMGNTSSTSNSTQKDDELINPNDARQLATLIGMTGGDITDVAVPGLPFKDFRNNSGVPQTRETLEPSLALCGLFRPTGNVRVIAIPFHYCIPTLKCRSATKHGI